MHSQRYCVYNQNNECFLSLGATLGDRPLARLRRRLGIGRDRADEGCWIPADHGKNSFGFFSSRDLVYLDDNHRVVHLQEAYPALRALPPCPRAKSLLALPVHSISSSRTQTGNQLVICAAQEMEQRLRDLLRQQQTDRKLAAIADSAPGLTPEASDPKVVATRRAAQRQRPAFSVAYYAEGGKLAVHAIRDLSATGLYLVTRDRWPVGSEVQMSLQPSGALDPNRMTPMTVTMRVTRWGQDGVGLEFAGSATDAATHHSPELKSPYVC
ncbi:MAG TPA: PilZ domain-containing protein [Terracidiphilus sp.]|jgi:hypothetical protein